jgi:hypothetical protein
MLKEEEDLEQAEFYDVRYPDRIDKLNGGDGDYIYSPDLALLGVRKGKKLITVVPLKPTSMRKVDGKYEKIEEKKGDDQDKKFQNLADVDLKLREEVLKDFEVRRFER